MAVQRFFKAMLLATMPGIHPQHKTQRALSVAQTDVLTTHSYLEAAESAASAYAGCCSSFAQLHNLTTVDITDGTPFATAEEVDGGPARVGKGS